MDTDQVEDLIRRNRILLAMANEERRACRETRARVYDTWQMSSEVRRRAFTNREKLQATRSIGWMSDAQGR
jgi:hypothetical protein